jgi:hypothetical protein
MIYAVESETTFLVPLAHILRFRSFYMLSEPLERLFASTASLPLPPLRLLPGEANQFPGGTAPR